MTGAAVLASGAASAGTGALPFNVTFESESAGIQNSTSQFSIEGVETFNELKASGPENNSSNDGVAAGAETFKTGFGLPAGDVTGTYSNVQIASYGTYGGAGGTGNFAVAPENSQYTLTLASNSKAMPNGITYFGFWLSALDSGNYVSFYDNSKLLFTFDPQDVINAVNQSSTSSDYYGNPNATWTKSAYAQGSDGSEPFVFLNFYAAAGTQFTKVVFTQAGGGGYESDNHTVGEWLSQTGTSVALVTSGTSAPPSVPTAAVPEPGAWALMLVGVGVVGAVLRTRRRMAMVAA
jgi:hypothetical protein